MGPVYGRKLEIFAKLLRIMDGRRKRESMKREREGHEGRKRT